MVINNIETLLMAIKAPAAWQNPSWCDYSAKFSPRTCIILNKYSWETQYVSIGRRFSSLRQLGRRINCSGNKWLSEGPGGHVRDKLGTVGKKQRVMGKKCFCVSKCCFLAKKLREEDLHHFHHCILNLKLPQWSKWPLLVLRLENRVVDSLFCYFQTSNISAY